MEIIHVSHPPLVSVVVPAYNQADFLAETIESVLAQSYPHFELVVVNDASPDHTDDIVGRFTDPRLSYVRHDVNRGLPAARNSGMRASNGEIIALLDADDLFLPEKLRHHVDFFQQHPEIGVSFNNRYELDHSAETIRSMWRPPRHAGLKELLEEVGSATDTIKMVDVERYGHQKGVGFPGRSIR